MWINSRIGHFEDWITQVWVKVTGRRFDPRKDPWLLGPAGDTAIIRDSFIQRLAEAESLMIVSGPGDNGLLESVSDLGLTTAEIGKLHPKVIDFYERTGKYHFEVWSEWCGFFRPFGWLLSRIFSLRLQQLNIPLSSIDSSKGIESRIIKLVDQKSGTTRWTIWYRILKSTKHVIYSGVYSTCQLPNYPGRFLKVVFPLPNGNATVIMRKEILPDGSLKLHSDGRKFGDQGFYFALTNHLGKHWAKYVRSMHEWITVYVDDEDVLRADHNLNFFGFRFLNLHYKMVEK